MIFRSNRFLYLVVRFSEKLHRKWTVKNVIVISIVSFQMASLKVSILLLRFICDWWISIRFVCFCVSRFVACDRNYD